MTSDASSIPATLATQLTAHVDVLVRIYCRLLPAEDQKDVAQDALAALVRVWRAEGGPRDPFTWLVATVRNLHAMRCRKRRRDRATVSLSHESLGVFEPVSRDDPWVELDRLLDEVVAPSFSEWDKSELRAFAAGKSRREIAQEVGATPSALEARIKKNLKRLRNFLGRGKSVSGDE